ncbi:MAG: diguanylate cyclase [Gammaproteobacteria bacterium]|nr:diguanylate cyclase [Gammaproteobacteria bacterium]
MKLAPQQILVVDDEKSNLMLLGELLRDEAHILLAKGGEQGLEKAANYRPDLILLDVMMPQMDGFEVMRRLRQEEATRAIPVIFITALNDAISEEKGLVLGACDYIQKPFHAAIVKARVKLHLELTRQRRVLEQLAHQDPLTSIANRRKLDECLEFEWRIALREQAPLSLVMVDIDFFKQYNDHYGHAAGDRALERVAKTLDAHMQRPRDLAARYGGEEFLVMLPNTDAEGALGVMQHCMSAIAALRIPHEPVDHHPWLSCSMGGVSCRPNGEHRLSEIMKLADDRLYQAKQQGRNTLCWEELR